MLGYVVDAASDATLTLPARQYVHAGEVAYDCEQASVAFRILQTGLPASLQVDPAAIGEFYSCDPAWSLIMDVAIVRCGAEMADDGTPPSPEKLETISKLQAEDAFLMMDAASKRATEAFGAVTASVAFATPAGGLVATIMTVTCAVW